MTFIGEPAPVDSLRTAIREAYLGDEETIVAALTA